MLCVRADRPLDPLTLNVLRAFASACGEARSEYFIVGATARDILLVGVFGLPAGRATRDLDIAVAVRDWEQFAAITGRLVGSGRFVAPAGPPHRLYYRREEGLPGFPIDLLPFRGAEQTPHRVAWPPDLEVIMSVAGYEDAFAAAEEVELEPGLTMRVVSLPGLALLKLLAWADAGAQARKHAQDLAVLLATYADAGNQDRLYGDEVHCLEVIDYDLELAGARLLGQDVRRLAGPQALREVQGLLGNAARLEHLAVQMAGGLPRLDDPEDRARRLLEQFASCVRET